MHNNIMTCVQTYVLVTVSNVGQVESVEKLFCILHSDTVAISLRRSAAEQLSVVLQGEASAKGDRAIMRVKDNHIVVICLSSK